MITLDATTKSLEVKLAGAITTNQLTIVASYVDINQTTIAVSGMGENDTVTNGATAVTAVAAPAATTSRQVKSLTVENTDTVAQTVSVQVNNNGTKRLVVVQALQAGQTLLYEDGAGWLIANALVVTTPVPVAQGGTGVTSLGNLTKVDDTNVTLALGGTPTGALINAVSITAGWTGSLAIARGGTGQTTAGASGVPTVVALTDGATPALDASLGNVFTLAAGGNRTIAVPSNATNGQKIVIRHLASGAARTLALNSGAGGFRFGTDITALTETASGKTDYIGCIYSSIDSKWDVVAVTKGF